MLVDVDTKRELSREQQAWVEEIKEVLYEADDLFDKVITIAKMKQLDEDEGNKFLKKVLHKLSRFFSPKNSLLFSYYTSQEVQGIHQKLDTIANNHAKYNFKADPESRKCELMADHQAALKRRTDTSSLLDENIIGREDDVKVIVDMLLDPNVEENVGFVVIVGIGGLGKTTLAQLVYNHNMIQPMFEKKLWVCVSDQDGKEFNVKTILKDIIESLTKKPCSLSTKQSLQIELQEELEKNKYLLILDDVWTENREGWNELRKYLTIGGRGSRIVITTRSEKTAEVILGKAVHSKKYMLKGLSDESAWRLFLLTAFEGEFDEAENHELTKIGKKIVKQCSNVPLAVKVLGTFLDGQTHKWKSFEKNSLPEIETAKNPIMSILKLSYDNLEPNIKNCFRYCALFPKDFVMAKRNLISLWYAQGYIGDSEDYFLILLNRCFFQYVNKNYFGDIISVKMHDLMHDLARELAGDEIIVSNSLPDILSRKNRHLFFVEGEGKEGWLVDRNVHTPYRNTVVKTLVINWYWLRSLCVNVQDSEFLSESIGELLHLRYLDLSENRKLKTLPNSIAKLYNLHCLVMRGCSSFTDWPKDFCKLINLRLLDIEWCKQLTYMPLGICKLINLRDLTDFNVGGASIFVQQFGGELKDLESLVNLRGELLITIHRYLVSENGNVCEDGYLKHIENLKVVDIHIKYTTYGNDQESLIAKLQPNENVMRFKLKGYNGTEIPRWGRAHDDWSIILPNLVTIELRGCERLDGIPLLSNLKHLKGLCLSVLNNLEYMETSAISHYSTGSKDVPFFPSLEELHIYGLESLKGWRGGVAESDSFSRKSHWLPPFPRLIRLSIHLCPKLTSFPPCPSLKTLRVTGIKNLLGISPDGEHGNLDIKNFSSLPNLPISEYRGLTSVLGALEHLTALEKLSLDDRYSEVDFDDMPWRSISKNLRSLKLEFFDTLEILPSGMKHLTALQKLSIQRFEELEELPEWISCLSSLHTLKIKSCPKLKSLGTIQNITSLQKLTIGYCERLSKECQKPSGKEWSKIQHIPHISITDW
ncbi:putative disease resistance protein RGA1 isoform X2 [Silene latifolia]